ncbi:hypothetical protein [uncultured Campylobacter sp.]|uniref:hypothetical protein n=1 Tax=uncultured Campylobacter sp. TaxID=218934 RepID=UPI0028E2ADD9|nr:hypothetical protein [uncultured Campylobacter sp.]
MAVYWLGDQSFCNSGALSSSLRLLLLAVGRQNDRLRMYAAIKALNLHLDAAMMSPYQRDL